MSFFQTANKDSGRLGWQTSFCKEGCPQNVHISAGGRVFTKPHTSHSKRGKNVAVNLTFTKPSLAYCTGELI